MGTLERTLAARLSKMGNLSVNNLVVDGSGNSPQINKENAVFHGLKEGQNLGTNTKMRWKNNEVLLAGEIVANNTLLSNVAIAGNLSVNNCNVVPIGTIIMWANMSTPDGFRLCDGSTTNNSTHPGLYEVIGTTFGGTGPTNFKLPDFVNHHPLGKAVSGIGVNLGDKGGAMNHNHTIPLHNHAANHTHQVAEHNHSLVHNHKVNHEHIINHTHSLAHVHAIASHTHTCSFLSASYNGYGYQYFTGTYTVGTHNHAAVTSNGWSGNTASTNPTCGRRELVADWQNLNLGTASMSTQNCSSFDSSDGLSPTGDGYSTPTSTNDPPFIVLRFLIRVK